MGEPLEHAIVCDDVVRNQEVAESPPPVREIASSLVVVPAQLVGDSKLPVWLVRRSGYSSIHADSCQD